MVFYKCEKCNKEFNQKCNYISHINKKFSCINTNEDKNIIIYKCDKCNKEFNQKCNYITHINRKIPCDGIDHENNQLLLKVKELEQENNIKQNKIILLEEENKRINELYNNLLDKCIKNNSNNIITNTNTVNNNNNTNNNTINITLKNFGNENYTKLTNEEQIRILKSNKQCVSNLIKCLHINDRLPEYKNICIKNLRGKGGYLYEGNKWLHCNFENLLIILFKNKINDLEKILNSNEGLISFNNNYIQNLIENYTDDMDSFIKNNKDNIINMLYNNTKNYKI